jgi:XRE family transcriptional regulator, aerobic/anaerobic benzoate catabolism transcriptional regulator
MIPKQRPAMNEVTNFRGEVVTEADTDAAAGEAFIALVGDRVRKARERKGITRKTLSELSHVSQRYLAQLEGGEGNISIALLHRVAAALDHRIEWLVCEEDPWASEAAQVASLYSSATTSQRLRVMQILNPGRSTHLRRQRICLIGLRGAGKSTLGRMLGESLNIPFMELNRDIEEQSGMPVNEVMALYGQEGYRRLERQALERIVGMTDCVVLAVAGGIVSEPETYNFLLRNFHTIWLKATPEEHMRRVRSQGDERPMAGNPKALEDLNSILKSRETLYSRAEAIVNTSGKSLLDSKAELLGAVKQLGVL